jgi:hypothetical protein
MPIKINVEFVALAFGAEVEALFRRALGPWLCPVVLDRRERENLGAHWPLAFLMAARIWLRRGATVGQ